MDLAAHFCWKKVLFAVGGFLKRLRLYRLYLLHDCRIFWWTERQPRKKRENISLTQSANWDNN